MPKPKLQDSKLKTQPSLEEFLNTYDAVTLNSALGAFDNSLGWELLKAYADFIRRQYEVTALDLTAKDGQEKAAAYASGYAKACALFPEFVEGLRKTVLGNNGVYEIERPEE